uniref:DNA adenine methylase n=1 Tax=uncultured Deinococcus sp. TaxID=158789 RepID=UPI0025833783
LPLESIAPSRTAPFMSPFLRWAGGKKLLLPKLMPFVPEQFDHYYEPFMGGAALFFALGPKKATLSDINPHLSETFSVVRDNVEDVIAGLSELKIDKAAYYQIRADRPHTPLQRAIRFIYLNKTCWNGLYRENSKGEFNVPFGVRAKHASTDIICEPQKLRAASQRLQGVNLKVATFADSVADAKSGDFVYFDPPYTVSHNENGFIEYNASIFSWSDQQNLATIARDLMKRGCHVVISNADHKAIHELYADFRREKIERSSTIANNKSNRRTVTELVITNYD